MSVETQQRIIGSEPVHKTPEELTYHLDIHFAGTLPGTTQSEVLNDLYARQSARLAFEHIDSRMQTISPDTSVTDVFLAPHVAKYKSLILRELTTQEDSIKTKRLRDEKTNPDNPVYSRFSREADDLLVTLHNSYREDGKINRTALVTRDLKKIKDDVDHRVISRRT